MTANEKNIASLQSSFDLKIQDLVNKMNQNFVVNHLLSLHLSELNLGYSSYLVYPIVLKILHDISLAF